MSDAEDSTLFSGGPGFYSFRERVFARLEEGREDEALGLARQARDAWPERGEIPFWLACILCRLGRPAEALRALEAGLDDGLWWAAHWLRDDDDLAPLRGLPRFAAVLERSERARAACLERPSHGAGAPVPAGVRLDPPGLTAGQPAGLLVALHGWGQRPADTAEQWGGALDEGLRLLAPASSQFESPQFHVWTDPARAAADVAAALAPLRETGELDERRLVLAGFSQGGGLAVTWSLTGEIGPPSGFVAFGAGVDDVDAAALAAAPAADTRRLRGALFIGREDPDLDGARELHERLEAARVACSLAEVPGLAHELPADAAPLVRGALRAVLPAQS